MSESDKVPIPREPECMPYIPVEFHIQPLPVQGAVGIQKANCDTVVDIIALKQDLEYMLGPPDTQVWFHGSSELANERTLKSYGLDSAPVRDIHITVKYR